jgi:hypothetical protein
MIAVVLPVDEDVPVTSVSLWGGTVMLVSVVASVSADLLAVPIEELT